MFETRVTRDIAIAHHNGPEGSKCYGNHGHTLRVEVVFHVADKSVLDNEFGWGPDFHAIKRTIDLYDHKDLNDELPALMPPSMERFAEWLFMRLWGEVGHKPYSVEIFESDDASVLYRE